MKMSGDFHNLASLFLSKEDRCSTSAIARKHVVAKRKITAPSWNQTMVIQPEVTIHHFH
jgi:hypothetical protein